MVMAWSWLMTSTGGAIGTAGTGAVEDALVEAVLPEFGAGTLENWRREAEEDNDDEEEDASAASLVFCELLEKI
jgi:hypothetical protein